MKKAAKLLLVFAVITVASLAPLVSASWQISQDMHIGTGWHYDAGVPDNPANSGNSGDGVTVHPTATPHPTFNPSPVVNTVTQGSFVYADLFWVVVVIIVVFAVLILAQKPQSKEKPIADLFKKRK